MKTNRNKAISKRSNWIPSWRRDSLCSAWNLSTTDEPNARLFVDGIEPPPSKSAGPNVYTNVPTRAEGEYFRLGSIGSYGPRGMMGAIIIARADERE